MSYHSNVESANAPALAEHRLRIGRLPSMDIASHMEKVSRMDAVHRRLDRRADFELWYWMALDAGNQAVNAALHACDITAEEPELASQVNDIYLRQAETGSWSRVVKRGADIIHPQMCEFEKPIPPRLGEAMDALARLEHYRDPCIRLGLEVSDEIIETCESAYDQVLTIARELVVGAGHEP